MKSWGPYILFSSLFMLTFGFQINEIKAPETFWEGAKLVVGTVIVSPIATPITIGATLGDYYNSMHPSDTVSIEQFVEPSILEENEENKSRTQDN